MSLVYYRNWILTLKEGVKIVIVTILEIYWLSSVEIIIWLFVMGE